MDSDVPLKHTPVLIITSIWIQQCHVMAPNFFYHGILQRNYRKMTTKWSFLDKSFVKWLLYDGP